MKTSGPREVPEFRVFGSSEDAEQEERREWLNMPREERMVLLEALRNFTYPDPNDRTSPQGLQRILAVVE